MRLSVWVCPVNLNATRKSKKSKNDGKITEAMIPGKEFQDNDSRTPYKVQEP